MTYTLAWRAAQELAHIEGQPFDVWREDDGEATTMFHRTDKGFLVRFLPGGDFDIDLPSKSVTYTPEPDLDEDYSLNLFSNQILPLLWTYDGTPVMHASCVMIDGGAYGFLGRSGRGKSTLAAAFARYGHAFLTDDGMVVEQDEDQVRIRPYLASIRLLPDSQSAVLGADNAVAGEDDCGGKIRIAASARIPHINEPVPLRAIYLLSEPAADDPIITPLSVPAGIDALLQHSFLLDSHDKVRVRSHFKAMAELAVAFPMFALDYPRDFSRLEETVATIAAHAMTKGCQR